MTRRDGIWAANVAGTSCSRLAVATMQTPTAGPSWTMREMPAHTSSEPDQASAERSRRTGSSRCVRSAPTSSIMTTTWGRSDPRLDVTAGRRPPSAVFRMSISETTRSTSRAIRSNSSWRTTAPVCGRATNGAERAGVDHVQVEVVGRVPLGGADRQRCQDGSRTGPVRAVDQQAALDSGFPPTDLLALLVGQVDQRERHAAARLFRGEAAARRRCREADRDRDVAIATARPRPPRRRSRRRVATGRSAHRLPSDRADAAVRSRMTRSSIGVSSRPTTYGRSSRS